MTVFRMEIFLRQQNRPRRNEPNFRDDQCLVARCLAAGVLDADRRCAALAQLVAIHPIGPCPAAACPAHCSAAGLARGAGPATATAGQAEPVGPLPAGRVADPRRHPRQADLGACQHDTWRVRRDLPLGSRAPVRRARLAAFAGLPGARAQPLWPDAGLRQGHGHRTGMQEYAAARMVRLDAPLSRAVRFDDASRPGNRAP